MRKKEVITAICIVAVVFLVFGGYFVREHLQEQKLVQEHNAALSNVLTPSPGEDLTITGSGDNHTFNGSLSIRVLDAAIYDNPSAAGPEEGFDPTEIDQSLFTDEMQSQDPFNLLVYHVAVKNMDATPKDGTSRSGAALFFMGEIANPQPSNEPLYLSDDAGGADRGYFSLGIGEEKTFTVAYAVRKGDADANAFSFSDSADPPTYQITLAAKDRRGEGSHGKANQS